MSDAAPAVEEVAVAEFAAAPVTEVVATSPALAPAPVVEVAPVEALSAPAPAPVPVATASVVAAVAASEAAPVASPVAALVAVAAPFVLPTDSLAQLAQEVGLEWVNSDADKVRAVQEAIANAPKPVHVPREIRRIELPDDGPLVLVETRRDLSAVKLPFEQSGG